MFNQYIGIDLKIKKTAQISSELLTQKACFFKSEFSSGLMICDNNHKRE